MFMDREDILNLYVVSSLPLPSGAIPEAVEFSFKDDIPFSFQLVFACPSSS